MLRPSSTHFHTFAVPSKTPADPSSFFTVPLAKTLNSENPKPLKFKFLVRVSASSSTSTSAGVIDHKTASKSAIQRIAEKLRSLGYTEEESDQSLESDSGTSSSAGEIFVPLPKQLPRYRVGQTIDLSWSTPGKPISQGGAGSAIQGYNELLREVKMEEGLEKRHEKKKTKEDKVPTLAELKLSKEELRRLRTLGIGLKQKLKIGKAGITEGIVNGIHERWRNSEVVKIVCEDLCRLNMKRTHDLLERKTGGMVVWRSGSKIILYRGAEYKYPYFLSHKMLASDVHDAALSSLSNDIECDQADTTSSGISYAASTGRNRLIPVSKQQLIHGVGSSNKVRFEMPGESEIAEEADLLLEGLGPRFTDWWGYDPQPVDADLLPAVVPGYRRPFRLLPYGISPKLTDDEMTTLRRLSRPLPCHFALGRNKKHQGLAAAIIKLWERCEIAKIAVKRGVDNTNSELMAEELKQLTGGTLLSRDRDTIVLYRGKDFLPLVVSSAIEDRRIRTMHMEKLKNEHYPVSDTVAELKAETEMFGPEGKHEEMNEQKHIVLQEEIKLIPQEEATRKETRSKLSMALERKAKAEKLIAELENAQTSHQSQMEKEVVSDEERYMLKKVGLKMKAFLLLGRRGVFDGTVENMHLHWKYRELVKVICKERSLEAVHDVARTLEAESGGILIAVERVNKEYAIIVYRGKNYSRPACLRPQTLLNKREAMKRSLEAQRHKSLKLHVLRLTETIKDLEHQIVKNDEENIKPKQSMLARDEDGGNSSQLNFHADMGDSNNLPDMQQRKLIGLYSEFDDLVAIQIESETSPDPSNRESCESAPMGVTSEVSGIYSTTCVDEHVNSGHGNNKRSSIIKSEDSFKLPAAPKIENAVNELPSQHVHLSNKERLLLRRHALKMEKRPLFAVGRSNIVTGVAKTLKAHFQKHPLAIVNVKGRAKGTSVQELALRLEQATGAVMVSVEPHKVILYRGWGAGEDSDLASVGTNKEGAKAGISPELLTAIRVECGLQTCSE